MLKTICILLSLFGASLSLRFHSSSKSLQVVPENNQPEDYVQYICPDLGDGTSCFTAYLTEACVCYRNGTCAYTLANKCSTCTDPEVVSVNEGQQCPSQTLNGTYDRCRQSIYAYVAVDCTTDQREGCICYRNGTCLEQPINACIDCQREGVAVVITNGSCPVNNIEPIPELETLDTEVTELSNPPVVPLFQLEGDELSTSQLNVCPDVNINETVCTTDVTPSCVCYINGTCAETDANRCSTCQDETVISVNQNEYCPTDVLNGTYTRCRPSIYEFVAVLCVPDRNPGCMCYNDGTCEEKEVNACIDCQLENAALVITGGSCPDNDIVSWI